MIENCANRRKRAYYKGPAIGSVFAVLNCRSLPPNSFACKVQSDRILKNSFTVKSAISSRVGSLDKTESLSRNGEESIDGRAAVVNSRTSAT